MGNEDKATLFDKLQFERDRYTRWGETGGVGRVGFGKATNLAALKWRAYVPVSMAPRCARIKLKRLKLFYSQINPSRLFVVGFLFLSVFTSRIEYFSPGLLQR